MSDRIDDPRRPDEPLESIDRSSENVLDASWPTPVLDDPPSADAPRLGDEPVPTLAEPGSPPADPAPQAPGGVSAATELTAAEEVGDASSDAPAAEAPEPFDAPFDAIADGPESAAASEMSFASETRSVPAHEHAPGELTIPPGIPVLEGEPRGERRTVGVVVSRFNGDVTTRLLESAIAELRERGVDDGLITVMPVPGAFELPIAAMALAKTRRFACIVALGCVIKGDTPHFDYVASESASGLQLAGIETGVPVAYGVLTLDRLDQAEARYAKGADAVRTALEMADIFANLRAAAAR